MPRAPGLHEGADLFPRIAATLDYVPARSVRGHRDVRDERVIVTTALPIHSHDHLQREDNKLTVARIAVKSSCTLGRWSNVFPRTVNRQRRTENNEARLPTKYTQNILGKLRKKGVKRAINNRKIIGLVIRNICILICDLNHKIYNY
jgi:hypothetical protein